MSGARRPLLPTFSCTGWTRPTRRLQEVVNVHTRKTGADVLACFIVLVQEALFIAVEGRRARHGGVNGRS